MVVEADQLDLFGNRHAHAMKGRKGGQGRQIIHSNDSIGPLPLKPLGYPGRLDRPARRKNGEPWKISGGQRAKSRHPLLMIRLARTAPEKRHPPRTPPFETF